MDTIYRFVWNALGLFLLAKGVYGDRVQISGFLAAVGVVLLLALAQALIRPALFLFRIIAFPLNLLTLGLASFVAGLVLNALAFFAIGQMHLIAGFSVRDFGAALGMTVLYSLVNAVGAMLWGRRQ